MTGMLTDTLLARAPGDGPRVAASRRAGIVAATGWFVVVVVLAYAPYALYTSITDQMVTFFMLLAMATMWNLLAGYTGLVSIGQQAYIGLGAYAVLQCSDWNISPFIGVFIAAVFTAAVALPTSFVAFRLRGDYFAVGTWVIAEVYHLITVRDASLGGGSGRTAPSLVTENATNREAYTYWVALAVAALAVAGAYAMMRSRLGLALNAVRDDERAAGASGVRVSRAKRIVYLIAAAGCGAAGGILLLSQLGVNPDADYSVQWSADMIFIVIIGGIGTLEGPLIGAVVFFALQQYMSDWGTWYLVLIGGLAIASAVFLPGGLWGTLRARTGAQLFPLGHRVVR